jgi:hypothetical protein
LTGKFAFDTLVPLFVRKRKQVKPSIFSAALLFALTALLQPAEAAYVKYTGTAYYGWTDQLGLFTPHQSSGLNDPVSLEIDFTPTSVNQGYYFFNTATFDFKVAGGEWKGTITLDPNWPSINQAYYDSHGLCCGGVAALSFNYNNNQYAGGKVVSIGMFGGNLNFDDRYFDPASAYQWSGYTYYQLTETSLSAHGGSIVFDPNAASSISSVPEPSTWAMMLLGFCGLGFVACRHKQRGNARAAV